MTLSASISACEPAVAGTGALAVVSDGTRSVVTKAFAGSPLRLLMPKNDGSAAWVYTSTFGGGLVGGDRIDLEVEVARDAVCFLSTQASTKVYRSATGAESRLSARVAPGGLLAIVPDPVVCFRASRFRQAQQFDLSPEASLVFVDWVTSGRRASGERWLFHEYTTCVDIRIGGRVLVHDPIALRAAEIDVSARMGRFDVLGLVVMLGPKLSVYAADVASQIQRTALGTRADHIESAAPVGDGYLFRIAGTSFEGVARTVAGWLDCLPHLLGDDPRARKW
jgi:urease accessory protein